MKDKVDKKPQMRQKGLGKEGTKPKMRKGQERQDSGSKYEGQGRQETRDERESTW